MGAGSMDYSGRAVGFESGAGKVFTLGGAGVRRIGGSRDDVRREAEAVMAKTAYRGVYTRGEAPQALFWGKLFYEADNGRLQFFSRNLDSLIRGLDSYAAEFEDSGRFRVVEFTKVPGDHLRVEVGTYEGGVGWVIYADSHYFHAPKAHRYGHKRNSKVNPHFPGKLGTGKRFAECVNEMEGRKGVYDPEGLCAYIGRRKYGRKGMARLAQNPSTSQWNIDVEGGRFVLRFWDGYEQSWERVKTFPSLGVARAWASKEYPGLKIVVTREATRYKKNPAGKRTKVVEYLVGSNSYATLARAKKKAQEYADDEEYPQTVIEETTVYEDRGILGGQVVKHEEKKYVVKPRTGRRNPSGGRESNPMKYLVQVDEEPYHKLAEAKTYKAARQRVNYFMRLYPDARIAVYNQTEPFKGPVGVYQGGQVLQYKGRTSKRAKNPRTKIPKAVKATKADRYGVYVGDSLAYVSTKKMDANKAASKLKLSGRTRIKIKKIGPNPVSGKVPKIGWRAQYRKAAYAVVRTPRKQSRIAKETRKAARGVRSITRRNAASRLVRVRATRNPSRQDAQDARVQHITARDGTAIGTVSGPYGDYQGKTFYKAQAAWKRASSTHRSHDAALKALKSAWNRDKRKRNPGNPGNPTTSKTTRQRNPAYAVYVGKSKAPAWVGKTAAAAKSTIRMLEDAGRSAVKGFKVKVLPTVKMGWRAPYVN